MIHIREDDLNKEDRIELVKTCKDIFQTTSKSFKSSNAFNVFKKIVQTTIEQGDLNRAKVSVEQFNQQKNQKTPLKHQISVLLSFSKLYSR
jgi:hypothetical protein